MIALPMVISIANLLAALALAGFTGWQPPAPTHFDRILRELADGRRPPETVRLETQCLEEGRLVNAAAYGTGVAIWNRERQGTLTRQGVFSLLEAFVSEGFAQMPAVFGEASDDNAPRSVKTTCRVRFSAEGTAKDVIQLEKGEQSAALKQLARGLLDAARGATRNAAPIASLNDGLAAVAGGRLAVETLRITIRSGASGGGRAKDPNVWVLRVDGRDTEIDPDVGFRAARRLEAGDVRELARGLVEGRFATLPPHVRAREYLEVTVAVLGQEHAVQAQPFAGGGAQDAEIRARFEQAVAPLVALHEHERLRD